MRYPGEATRNIDDLPPLPPHHPFITRTRAHLHPRQRRAHRRLILKLRYSAPCRPTPRQARCKCRRSAVRRRSAKHGQSPRAEVSRRYRTTRLDHVVTAEARRMRWSTLQTPVNVETKMTRRGSAWQSGEKLSQLTQRKRLARALQRPYHHAQCFSALLPAELRARAQRPSLTLSEYLRAGQALDERRRSISTSRISTISPRAAPVKTERHPNKPDRVFGQVFKGLDPTGEAVNAKIPAEWLQALTQNSGPTKRKRRSSALWI